MIEVLFILTTIFVAYVAYALVSEQKAAAKPKAPNATPEKKVVAEEQSKPKAVATKAKPAATKAVAKPAVAKAAAPKAAVTKAAPPKPVAAKPAATKAAAPKVAATKAAAVAQGAGLKDPKTKEVTTAYSNYRFTKRWIKDALVAEGLLDKVYANNELDTATEAKIKRAIGQLESMPKYRA